jgi:general secretion pathway protein M
MNRWLGQAGAWWSGRTLRERRMLMVMTGLLAATSVWLGVVQPVLAWREAAAARAGAAALTLAEVRAAVASLGPVRASAPPPAEGLEPLIQRTAAAAPAPIARAGDGSSDRAARPPPRPSSARRCGARRGPPAGC